MSRKRSGTGFTTRVKAGFGVMLLGIGVLYSGTLGRDTEQASRDATNPIHHVQSIQTRPIQSAWWCTAFSIVCREATAEYSTKSSTDRSTVHTPEGTIPQQENTTENPPVVFKWKLAEWWRTR